MEINENNISTIATMVWASIINPILIYFGIQVDQVLGTAIVSAIILLGLLVWSAMNPNRMGIFGNKPQTLAGGEPVLNDEYITGDDDDS